MAAIIFETGNPGRLGVPAFLAVFMVVIFGMPAILLPATTWDMVPEHPVLLPAVYVLAFFPLAVLFVLRRLMARYAMRLFADGAVELVLPFKTHRLAAANLARIVFSAAGAANRGRQPFANFVGPDGRVAASVAASAFSTGQWHAFLDALRSTAPNVTVEGFG